MEDLILTINLLQTINNKYELQDLQLPQIIVIGSQSSGKSSVMERIIGFDILPKAAKVATRCPIILQLINCQDDSFDIKADFEGNSFIGPEKILKELQSRTEKIGQTQEGVTSNPIIVQLSSSTHPTLTLIDLPGIIKNDGELPAGSSVKINQLTEYYAEMENSLILAISSANVDLANSDSISIAKKFDKQGTRTLNVITKIDLMDKGTTVSDILNHSLLQDSLGVICVVNRSQESVTKKLSIRETNEKEIEYINSKSDDITGNHGVKVLITMLVKKLEKEIKQNIPSMLEVISNRIECLKSELEDEFNDDKALLINKILSKFVHQYKKFIRGESKHYPDEIVGGSLISKTLYEDFAKEISELKVKKLSKENMQTLIQNTTGNKKMSYSIEKPFTRLMEDEIECFRRPSLECAKRIDTYLKEFVHEIIKQFNLYKYDNLRTRMVIEMNSLIDKKHNYTKKIIDEMVYGEKKDIYCIKPNTTLFETIGSKLLTKISDMKNKAFYDVIDSVTNIVSIALPLPVRIFLNVVNDAGYLGNLKKICSKSSQDWKSIPPTLQEYLNKSSENPSDRKTVTDFLSNEKKIPEFLGKLISTSKTTEEISDSNYDNNVLAIEDMVAEYFKEIQQNFIRNVPKWIQAVFVHDVLKNIDDSFHCIRMEDNKENLLIIDPKTANEIKENREELKELEGIQEKLLNLKRHQ